MGKKSGRADGRKTVTFTFEGKRYYCYGRTKAEAKEAERVKRQELAEGSYKRSQCLTLSQYYDRWIEARRGTVKGATLRKQQFQFEAAATVPIDANGKTFGELLISEIETQHIRILQKDLLIRKDKHGKPLKGKMARTPETVNGIIALISHILHDAVNERAINWNPCSGVKNLKRTDKPARETIHRALSIDETRSFFQAAAESWYYDLYRFLLATGCRCGEAGALKLSDIKDDRILIRKTVTKNEFGVYVIGDTPKTRYGRRDIPMTAQIREIIDHQRLINNAVRRNNVVEIDRALFTTSWGNLLAVANVDRDIARICKRIGIPKFTAHAFRDTFATRAIESGMKPKTLQEILGHADISITMNLYAHVMEETKANEMQLVVALPV